MLMFTETVHGCSSGSEVSKSAYWVASASWQLPWVSFSFTQWLQFLWILILYSLAITGFWWKFELCASLFLVSFLLRIMLRSGHGKKESIIPKIIVTISGHGSCAWNKNLWPVHNLLNLIKFHKHFQHIQTNKEGSVEKITTQLSPLACSISATSLYCENVTLKHNMVTIHVVKKILRLQNDNFKLSWDFFIFRLVFP